MDKINQFFNKKPIYWFAAGTIIRQLVSFIMLPIYTSHLTPTDYGVLSLLLMTMSIFEIVVASRFGMALPKFYYDRETAKERDRVIITAFCTSIPVSLIGVTAFYFASPMIASIVLEKEEITNVVQVYSILLCTSTIETYVMILFRLKKHIAFFFFTSLLRLLVQLSLNIYLVVFLDMGLVGVLYSSVIVSCAFALLSIIYTFKTCIVSFSLELAKELYVFSFPLWFVGLGGIAVTSATQILIKEFASVADVGLYQLGTNFAMIIAMLLWMPFSQWWQTERFKIVRNEGRHRELPLIFQIITFVLVLGAIGISLLTPIVLKMMVTPAFYPPAALIPVLCFNLVLNHLGFMYNLAYLHTKNTKIMAYLTWGNAIFRLTLLSVLTYYFGLVGAAYALLLASFVSINVTYFITKRYFTLNYNLYKTLAIGLICFFSVLFMQSMLSIELPYVDLIVRSGVGIIVIGGFLALSIFSNAEVRHYCISAIKH
ncbi:lipopolysaccharide biosynthesis protein [Alteromonas sp. ASW11-130]|uniref:lipopolysaccharide biosynthesis protein n=1 Tax=Alteromonas sp. ASW11-130 TaxID=3015775 RepID=UPI002241F4FC|nr:oligosaccharide flippase family protein [Alteromonas sp. ASW11-130]MCW8091282.1 oligosaccharide flippase family protein [Alteromonas sp. ASW11-130]